MFVKRRLGTIYDVNTVNVYHTIMISLYAGRRMHRAFAEDFACRANTVVSSKVQRESRIALAQRTGN